MRKTIRKLFWVWDFDKEEAWLNEMAAKGLALVSVGFCRYDFEESLPGEYGVRLELLSNRGDHPESVKYIEFLEETGAEHVGTFKRWVYLRKKKADGEFELFSDRDSRIRHLRKIIRFVVPLSAVCLIIGAVNVVGAFTGGTLYNGVVGAIDVLMGAFAAIGCLKLRKKEKRLKSEQYLYE